jgi:hypothetical protein
MWIWVTRSPVFFKVTTGLAVALVAACAQEFVAAFGDAPGVTRAAKAPDAAAESLAGFVADLVVEALAFPPLLRNGTKVEGMIKVGCRI